MHTLILQAVEETLAGGVIPAIALAAHRREHAVVSELFLKVVAAILAAAIRVMNQPWLRTTPEPRHAQGIDHQILGHPLAHRPADDPPGVEIEHDRQVQPALAGGDESNVRRPYLIWTLGLEVLIKPVRRHWQRVLRVRRRFEPPLVPTAQTVLPHQPLDPTFADRNPAPLELQVDPRRPVGRLRLFMNLPDPRQQLPVAEPLLGAFGTLPSREATVTHLQRYTQRLQRIRAAILVNKRVPHSDSLAKYAAAFFMISISIFSRAFSARSRKISICSGVIGLPLAAVPSFPAVCVLTQLRIVCSGTPSSRAPPSPAPPPRPRRNASSLNSSVYRTLGIFFIEHLQQHIIACYRWCPITAGKLSSRAGGLFQ